MAGLSSCKNKSARIPQLRPAPAFFCLLSQHAKRHRGSPPHAMPRALSMTSIRRSGSSIVLPSPGSSTPRKLGEINGAAQRILQRAVGIIQRRRLARGPAPASSDGRATKRSGCHRRWSAK